MGVPLENYIVLRRYLTGCNPLQETGERAGRQLELGRSGSSKIVDFTLWYDYLGGFWGVLGVLFARGLNCTQHEAELWWFRGTGGRSHGPSNTLSVWTLVAFGTLYLPGIKSIVIVSYLGNHACEFGLLLTKHVEQLGLFLF